MSGAERRALSTFLGLLSAHLKTWEMGEYLSHEKAQEMAQTAAAWSHRLGDREWFLRPGEEWPPPYPSAD